MLNRLLLGGFEHAGWLGFKRYRSDYIGHEIDRFFRASKAAVPGMVVIGQAMSSFLNLKFTDPGIEAADVFKVLFADGRPLFGCIPKDNIYAIKRILKAEELKGIESDYVTYALFAPRSLKGMLVQEESDQKNGYRTFPLDNTRELVPMDALQLLVDSAVPSPPIK